MPSKPNITMITLHPDTPDRRTALNDLRAALCIYVGVELDDIHPASGHDLSLDSYLSIRAQWAEQHAKNPDEWTNRNSAQVRAMWEHDRPKYLAGHPWPTIPGNTD